MTCCHVCTESHLPAFGKMVIFISFIYLICCSMTAATSDLICIQNTTCVNNEVCRDNGCECPSSHYGPNCEFAVTNALIIVLICILPPVSWLAVCYYGVRSKGAQGLWSSRERSSDEIEQERDVVEEVINDQPPPSYDQSKYFSTAGTSEGVNIMIEETGLDHMEPPPSYQEWARKAESLRNQEIGGREGISLVTISDNSTLVDRAMSREAEDQC